MPSEEAIVKITQKIAEMEVSEAKANDAYAAAIEAEPDAAKVMLYETRQQEMDNTLTACYQKAYTAISIAQQALQRPAAVPGAHSGGGGGGRSDKL